MHSAHADAAVNDDAITAIARDTVAIASDTHAPLWNATVATKTAEAPFSIDLTNTLQSTKIDF